MTILPFMPDPLARFVFFPPAWHKRAILRDAAVATLFFLEDGGKQVNGQEEGAKYFDIDVEHSLERVTERCKVKNFTSQTLVSLV